MSIRVIRVTAESSWFEQAFALRFEKLTGAQVLAISHDTYTAPVSTHDPNVVRPQQFVDALVVVEISE